MNAPQRTSLAAALGLALLAGCDQPTGSTRPRSSTPIVAAPEPVAEAPAPAPAPVAPRPILGEKTQIILDASKEAKAGGVETAPRITAKDPILLVGNAYVSIIGQAATQNIQHALEIYKAGNDGEYPKTTEEFMEKIIKANNIALPKLPFYQEYAFKPEEHKLIIMEYPDRKAAANYPK